MNPDEINTDAARLEINARAYHYDPTLDAACDVIEQGPTAWRELHPKLLSVAAVHLDLRNYYRAAVRAGVVPDDRSGPDSVRPTYTY